MKTPQINTYTYKSTGTSFKAFEIKQTYQVAYDDLHTLLMTMLKFNDCGEKSLYQETTKSNILKEMQSQLYENGASWKVYCLNDLTNDDLKEYQDQADQIIKQHWFEIWQDYHEQKKLSDLADFILTN